MTERAKWITSILGWLFLVALGIGLILCIVGCQWATHERLVIRTPATEKRITEGRRYVRVWTEDGTVHYGWIDKDGKLHLVKEGAK